MLYVERVESREFVSLDVKDEMAKLIQAAIAIRDTCRLGRYRTRS